MTRIDNSAKPILAENIALPVSRLNEVSLSKGNSKWASASNPDQTDVPLSENKRELAFEDLADDTKEKVDALIESVETKLDTGKDLSEEF